MYLARRSKASAFSGTSEYNSEKPIMIPTPEPEHVSWLMKLWVEIKHTPSDVLIGFMTMLTVMIKLVGRATRQKIERDPKVTRSQMDECKKEIIDHVDGRFNHLEKRMDNHLENK